MRSKEQSPTQVVLEPGVNAVHDHRLSSCNTLGTLLKPMAQRLFTNTEPGILCKELVCFEYVFCVRYQALCLIGLSLTVSKGNNKSQY